MMRRRAILIMLVAMIGVLLAGLYAYILPPTYETEAKILVESQQIPDALAQSTVNSTAFERLKLIEQRLMSRDRLIQVIDKLTLYRNREDLTLLDKIEALRQSTRIHSTLLGSQRRRDANTEISAFSIIVRMDNARQAAAVANEFVSIVLQQNLQARSQRARETLEFFEEESNRIGTALADLDNRMTTYKTENEAYLPESLGFRREEITRLQDSMLEIERTILELEEQRGALETGLTDDLLPNGRNRLSIEEEQLRGAKAELAQKLTIFAENHPDIRELRGRIASLEVLVGAVAEDQDSATEAANNLQTSRQRAVQRQITRLGDQIVLLETQKNSMEQRRQALEDSVLRTPTVETNLNAMVRRQDELQEQYAAIVRKRADAETGDRLEVNQQAERFEVIENALVPREPFSPNRKKIVVMGSAASIVLALGLVFLLDQLNPTIRSTSQMQRTLKITPVVAIPHVYTEPETVRRRVTLASVVLVVLLGVPYGIWMIDRHVRPLESIVDTVVEKSGAEDMLRMLRTRF